MLRGTDAHLQRFRAQRAWHATPWFPAPDGGAFFRCDDSPHRRPWTPSRRALCAASPHSGVHLHEPVETTHATFSSRHRPRRHLPGRRSRRAQAPVPPGRRAPRRQARLGDRSRTRGDPAAARRSRFAHAGLRDLRCRRDRAAHRRHAADPTAAVADRSTLAGRTRGGRCDAPVPDAGAPGSAAGASLLVLLPSGTAVDDPGGRGSRGRVAGLRSAVFGRPLPRHPAARHAQGQHADRAGRRTRTGAWPRAGGRRHAQRPVDVRRRLPRCLRRRVGAGAGRRDHRHGQRAACRCARLRRHPAGDGAFRPDRGRGLCAAHARARQGRTGDGLPPPAVRGAHRRWPARAQAAQFAQRHHPQPAQLLRRRAARLVGGVDGGRPEGAADRGARTGGCRALSRPHGDPRAADEA